MKLILKIIITLLVGFVATDAYCQKVVSRPNKHDTKKQSNITKSKRQTRKGGNKSKKNLQNSSKTEIGHVSDFSNETEDRPMIGGVPEMEYETPAETIANQEIDEETPESIIAALISNMILVEGGEYDMGSMSPYSNRDERPVHKEKVESFHIGKYEVTQREWESVMGYNPSSFKGPFLPVENVSWDDCQRFIEKLNELTGMIFRLPSEVEWEYAARGGVRSGGYEFSGDNDINNVACFYHWKRDQPNLVGSMKPNELGIYDMTGNVWEWVSDRWCDDYSKPRKSPYYVRRGGGWNDPEEFCRVAYRSGMERTYKNSNTGFRIAY